MKIIDQCRTGPTEPPFDRNASRYAQCRVRKRSNKCGSENRLVKSQRSGVALTERGGSWGPRRFVHLPPSTACGRIIFGPELGLYQNSLAFTAQILSTYRSVRLHNSFTCMGNRIDYFSSGSSDGTAPSIGSLEHFRECDPAGAGTISKFARLHNAQFLSTYRSVRLHNSFTCMGNRIDYFLSGSSMEPHRALAHSSILCNVIQIFSRSHFFEHRGNHTDYFFRAGARTEPHQLGQISCSLFFYLPSSVGLLLTVRTRFLYE